MVGRTWTGALAGVDSIPVRVEVDVGQGLPAFTIVGLPDTAVQESRERVRSALVNCGLDFPLCRLTANLAPADVRKEGPVSDMAIALAILAASGQVPAARLDNVGCFGELSLEGDVRPVAGMLCHALGSGEAGLKELLVPADSAGEAALAGGPVVRPVNNLGQAVAHLTGRRSLPSEQREVLRVAEGAAEEDFSDVKGQPHAKRALEIAAAGGHNALLLGSPGSGKTMLARRLPSVLPPMEDGEALEVVRLQSVTGPAGQAMAHLGSRPFRAPHHTVSVAGLAGGGSPLRPGEVSLAHHGVLFLDEIAEFGKASLQVLRQPMEDGAVWVSRASGRARFPAAFMLVGAMNPCPCGYLGDDRRECTCSASEIQRYRAKLSGPLLDRIDLIVEMRRPSFAELAGEAAAEASEPIRERVAQARLAQASRPGGNQTAVNARLRGRALRQLCVLDDESRRFLESAVDKLALTGRGHDRVLRVARTIADLEGLADIRVGHVAEAVQYRAPQGVL